MGKRNTARGIKELFESLTIGKSIKYVRKTWKEKRPLIIAGTAIGGFVSIVIGGYITNLAMKVMRRIHDVSFGNALYCGIRYPVLTFAIFFGISYMTLKFVAGTERKYKVDEERNYKESEEGVVRRIKRCSNRHIILGCLHGST